MSLRIRRGAKSAGLGLVKSRAPDALSSAVLNVMKIGSEPGLESGYEGGAKAAACVSVDFDVTSPERHPWNHAGTAALLSSAEKHGVPLTWAICGKTAVEDPEAYRSILGSPARHEVGVHTYSHIYADSTEEGEYERDIERCVGVLGLPSPPTTFVFPKNREGHFALLQRMGFRSFRGARRVIGAPVRHQGLWNVRPVYYVDGKSLHAEGLIRKFVDACIARSSVFHLWTHPWSLAIDGKVDRMSSEVMDPVFGYLREKRDEGSLSLTTMGGLADFLESAEKSRA
ncbi:MAG: polysaccharide deacetylase family protein [Nitrososphaerota archaeon]|nr:polysaccharide deacetylase family protein [Nitrososphaerota archaeon]